MVSLVTLKKYYDVKAGKDAGFRNGIPWQERQIASRLVVIYRP